MRYRPFGNSGMAVSVVSLLLQDHGAGGRARAGDWRSLLLSALECGINCFEVAGTAPAMIEGLGEALSAVERRLVFVSWRLGVEERRGLGADEAANMVQAFLTRTNLGYLDLLMLQDPPHVMSLDAISRLTDLQEARLTKGLGVAGSHESIDRYIATNAFEALATPYNLASGWKERHRMKSAAAQDMAVVGYEVCPEALREPKRPSLLPKALFKRREPLADVGGYNFLHATRGWTPEELCLAYALTEPAITTVRIDADRIERIQRLSDIPERDLPTGVAAQIEMARFSQVATGAA